VAQAQRDLLASQLSEAQAAVGYLLAVVTLYRLEGTLLERSGIEAGPPD
jgi:outer membrane protein TolC